MLKLVDVLTPIPWLRSVPAGGSGHVPSVPGLLEAGTVRR
jgi:hypothetical protein